MKDEKVFKLDCHTDKLNFLRAIDAMLEIPCCYPSKVKAVTNPDGSITLTLMDKERTRWINEYFYQFVHHPNAACKVLDGKRTVVSYYSQFNGLHMGTSCPINGDKYDEETGIAIAFAKAMGEKIPDFI